MSYQLTFPRAQARTRRGHQASPRARFSVRAALHATDRFDVFADDVDEADPRFRSTLPEPVDLMSQSSGQRLTRPWTRRSNQSLTTR